MATNVRLSGAQTTPRAESDIRVSYTDTTKIIAAANALDSTGTQAQFYSSDGGTTWGQTRLGLTGSDTFHSDPAVDWTSDGTAWSITIGLAPTANVLRCYKSTDDGQTWNFDSTPSGTQNNVDREIMWVDHSPTSPYKDQIYVIWHQGVPGFVAVRTAGAGGSWQTPVQISGSEQTGSAIGADIKTNSFGDVFAFYPDPDGSGKLRLAKSTDGGTTFKSPRNDGTGFIEIATLFATTRRLSIPSDRADISRGARVFVSGGAFRNATKDLVYMVWPDLSGDSGCTTGAGPGSNASSTCKARIWSTRSTDGGAHWDAPRMLNNQASLNDQSFPRLVVDDYDGSLVLIYYDTVDDPTRLKTDIWMQSSTDDGVTWSAARKITSAETDETAAGANTFSYGDYSGLSGYAGNLFGCWTDRRSGGVEELWGAPVTIVQQAVAVILNRNPIGQDEVDARRSLGLLPIQDAFRVVVDGFNAGELQISGPGTTLALNSTLAAGVMPITCAGNTSDSGNYGPEVQRFTFHYNVDFDATDSAFSAATVDVTLSTTAGGLPASAILTLIKQPDPFMLHGDPSWLSVDLRFLVARQNQSWFGVPGPANAADAPRFIQQLMSTLTPGQFDGLPPGEEDTKLYTQPNDENSVPVFNFALAKVHYIGLIGAAQVRVFFRLFNAQTTTSTYDYPPGAQYRRGSPAVNPHHQPIPLAGILGGEYVTLPFFAAPRIDTTLQSMDQQTDDPYNVQDITAHADGSEVDKIFGCWLDINQPSTNVLPTIVPPNQDGPYNPSDPNPLFRPLPIGQAIARGLHQCLIAEVAFDPTPIPPGKDSSNWDKLAQRNVAWADVNAAQAGTTFEIRPTALGLPAGQTPDELMIDWNTTPDGEASIYLPAVNAADVVAVADRTYATHRLSHDGAHTIRCKTGGITYVPIPPSGPVNYAGLLTVDVNTSGRRGETFTVVVRQLTNAFGHAPPPPPPPQIALRTKVAPAVVVRGEIAWRRVIGAFQLTIPVKTKEALLLREERDLSVLRWIAQAIPTTSRWYPVFHRYLGLIGGRVGSFGGDPSSIFPSPTGDGIPGRPRPKPDRERCYTGKIESLTFDGYGDFIGFVLETECEDRCFYSREGEIERLAQWVWRERLRITVVVCDEDRDLPQRIIIHKPPAQFTRADRR